MLISGFPVDLFTPLSTFTFAGGSMTQCQNKNAEKEREKADPHAVAHGLTCRIFSVSFSARSYFIVEESSFWRLFVGGKMRDGEYLLPFAAR